MGWCGKLQRKGRVPGSKDGKGAGSRPAVWEWPRCGGRVVQTKYLNSRCLPQVVPCSEMPNDRDTSTVGHRSEVKENGDNHYTTSLPSFSHLADFEIKECKKEPDPGCWASDDLSEFDKSSTNLQRTLHIPPGIMVKSPIVLLERCDKIWETLQLIRIQCISPTIERKDDEKEKKRKNESQKIAHLNMTFPIKSQGRRTISDSKTLFQFSVQKTRRLYPCITCGKQYLEKRSLRRHSLRVHGVIIPVKFKRTKKLKTVNKQGSSILPSEGNNNSNKVHNNKYSHEKMTTGKSEAIKLAPIFTNSKRLQNISNVASSNVQYKNMDTEPLGSSKPQFSKCALCQQKVKSVKKHLINYHKIGCSTNMLKQLEMSLLSQDRSSSSGSSKPRLKDILSGKPPQASVNRDTQNKSYTASSESKTRETSQAVPQKRKYTLSYMNAKKKFKLNNGHYVAVQKTSNIAQRHVSIKNKCDICLGVYATPNNLAKHKRIHISRGETKENFHTFVCNYFNSPLSKRYKQTRSSLQSTNTDTENGNNSLNGNLQLSDPKTSSQDQRISRASTHDLNKEDTTCLCGRSFRNQLILRAHKDNCKSYKRENKMAQHSVRDEYSSDRDSGIGINITIKKRNNSYEIVGKDGDECKQTDHVTDGILSSDVSHNPIKEATNADARQKSNASKYSKNHSVLKLQVADEDLIIDVEEDAHLLSKQKRMQTNVKQNDKDCSQKRKNDDAAVVKEENTLENVRSLKQMCEEVLTKFTTLQELETEDTHREKEKRSANTSNGTTKKERVKSEVSMVNFNLTTCAYCNKHFDTINLYNKHQCTVKEGRRFDEYSLNLLCFSCNATLNSCNQFDEHMRNKHNNRNSYHCYLCPEKFWQKKTRNRHTNTQHDTSCRFCHMNIPLWTINLHESYHLGFGYPCHKCKKAYSTKKNIAYHNSTIHKNSNDTMTFCNLCLKSFKPKIFQSHVHSHDSRKCYFCDKKFNDRAATEYHTLIYHGGAFSKLKCNECGMRYLTKKQLEQHKNTAGCNRLKRIKEKNML